MDVVTTSDGYKVFWTEQNAVWSRRVLFDGTWPCEAPTLVVQLASRPWTISGVIAGAASWFSWVDADDSSHELLTLPSGVTHTTQPVVQLSRVNSVAIGLFGESNWPYSSATYSFAAAETDSPFVPVPVLRKLAWQASVAGSEGNAMLFASTDLAHLYGSPVTRVSTSVLTVTGGDADVVPAAIPAEACPPPILVGEGGAAGTGGAPSEGGASSGGSGLADGGAVSEPVAGSGGSADAGQGGEPSSAGGRDSGGAPAVAHGGAAGESEPGEGGSPPNEGGGSPSEPGQPAGGISNGSTGGGGEAGASDGPRPAARGMRESKGCGCRTVGNTPEPGSLAPVVALLALLALRRQPCRTRTDRTSRRVS
jgi:MYXO-CTERM domain-containing protein